MSSTERAPEPTMEEILASIRRIISDEEANAPKEAEAPAADEYPVRAPSGDADYEVADTQIIDDIARVLSGDSGAPPDSGEDDILDLTDLGLTDDMPVDELTVIEETVVLQSDVPFEIEADEPYESRKPDFSMAFPPAAEADAETGAPEPLMQEAAATETFPAEETFEPDEPAAAEPEPAYEAPSEAQPVEEAVAVAAPPPPSLDDPTSALERAIAALKAGDLSAFAREADPAFGFGTPSAAAPADPAPTEPEPVQPEPEPEPELQPEPEQEPMEQAHPVLAAEDQPLELDAGWEPEPNSAWTEDITTYTETESVAEPEIESDEMESEAASAWREEDRSWSKPAPTPINEFLPGAARSNGGSGHKQHHEFEEPVASKSLEDSVKEMLRPMLRQWLDENMHRVLTAALREELENASPPNTTRRGY